MDFRAILEKLNKKLDAVRSFVRKTMKLRYAKTIAAVSAIAILFASSVAIVSASASGVVYVDGEAVCKVGSRSEFNKAMALLEKLHVENGVSDRTDKKITCSFTLSTVEKVSASKCADILYKECLDDYVRAYCISMKGIEIGFCATYSEAEQVVEHFREHIIDSVLENNSVADFVELTTDFSIDSKICRSDRVMKPETLCRTVLNVDDHDETEDEDSSNRVTAGGAQEFLYVDKNFAFGMLKNEAEVELPKFDFSFNLGQLNSSIEFKTCVIETYSEIVPFETITVETDELYIGQSKIQVQGENGIADNEYEIAYIDGIEVSKTLISSNVISEPIACIKLVGTKNYPSTAPTGSFMWPVLDRFVITSIYAADGGVVTFASYSGTYGLIVKISHENGVETRYAHMDRIDVKVGDRVYKGQMIGTMGITGRVTGPHVHFEVRINGKPVNPRNYLPSAKPWEN